jgi:glycine/D-amino acid oxidase-like deaminating enzyme
MESSATFGGGRPTPTPRVEGAVRFDNQAEFHVRKYLLALADQLAAGDCEIYENSRAVEVDEDKTCVVKTPGGRVIADRVVVATHYPFLDRSLAFARVQPQRSYALLCRLDGVPPAGMSPTLVDAPGRTRTCDPRLRRPPLYPAELPGRVTRKA